MIQTQNEISAALRKNYQDLSQYINSLDKETFENMPGGAWSAGQQLDHLIKAVRPLNWIMPFPKWFISMLFGKNNRKPRTYPELVERYHDKLSQGGKASAPFVPPMIPFEKKDQKLMALLERYETLILDMNNFTDTSLDTLLLPHPLLGKLTIREMLFFTVYHTEHHLNNLQKRSMSTQ